MPVGHVLSDPRKIAPISIHEKPLELAQVYYKLDASKINDRVREDTIYALRRELGKKISNEIATVEVIKDGEANAEHYYLRCYVAPYRIE